MLRAYSRTRQSILRGVMRAAPRLRSIAAGYAAKVSCSALFLSGREIEGVVREDLQIIPGLTLGVDRAQRTVRARVGGCERQAIFRPGLGAALVAEGAEVSFPALAPRPDQPKSADPWPDGDEPGEPALSRSERERLATVLEEAFAEPDSKRPRRTRAMVVVHRGQIVAERYAPGFGPATPLLGWSMTKSVVNALSGVLVARGALDIHTPLRAPEWGPDDPRSRLTFDHLLRMSSGLRFWEQYWNPLSHVSSMLFHHPAAAAYAASFPLVAEPDTRWSYASGSTNLLTRALRDALGGDHAAYLSFPARALFDRIGMRSAQVETDPSGHLVGSSFSYATARDWARFGLLYLRDGEWEGERILPEGWVSASRRPTPAAPLGEYGAHFWLNAGAPGDSSRCLHPGLPRDAFFARGYEEQSVSIIPSRDAVVVRLGQTADRAAWDLEDVLAKVLKALPES